MTTTTIKVSTTSENYKLFMEYEPITRTASMKIRVRGKDNDLVKLLSISLHSLSGIIKLVDENDEDQTICVLSALYLLKNKLFDDNLKTPEIFNTGAFTAYREKVMTKIRKEMIGGNI